MFINITAQKSIRLVSFSLNKTGDSAMTIIGPQ